jgi:hypothetical protein
VNYIVRSCFKKKGRKEGRKEGRGEDLGTDLKVVRKSRNLPGEMGTVELGLKGTLRISLANVKSSCGQVSWSICATRTEYCRLGHLE